MSVKNENSVVPPLIRTKKNSQTQKRTKKQSR